LILKLTTVHLQQMATRGEGTLDAGKSYSRRNGSGYGEFWYVVAMNCVLASKMEFPLEVALNDLHVSAKTRWRATKSLQPPERRPKSEPRQMLLGR
jgi:hypothetical protein